MKLHIILFWILILILFPIGLFSKSLSSKSKEYSSDSENFNARPEVEQSVIEGNEPAFHDNYRPRHKFKTIGHRPRYHRSDFDIGNEQDFKSPQCAVMYKDNEPVGILQPFEESYRFLPVNGDPTLVDLNPIPPVKRKTIMDVLYPSKIIDDDYTEEVVENTNQFTDDRYPSIFAKFKIDSRLDKSMNPDLNKKRSMFKRGSEKTIVDQDPEGSLKSTPSQVKGEDSVVVEEELKNILDDIGLIDDYGDKDDVKREAEDENLELGTNKISLVKEEHKEKREKRNFASSTAVTSSSTAFLVDSTGFPVESTSEGGSSLTIPPPTKAKFGEEHNEEGESIDLFNSEPVKIDEDSVKVAEDTAKFDEDVAKIDENAAIAAPDSSSEAEIIEEESRERRQLDTNLAEDKKEKKRNLEVLAVVNPPNVAKDAELNLDKDAELNAEKDVELNVEKDAELNADKDAELNADKDGELNADKDPELSIAKETELNEAKDAEVNGAKDVELNDYEKRVEREIRDKIQKLKDEVKQEISQIKLKDTRLKSSLLSDLEAKRKKRQAVNTLVNEESEDIDPTLDDDEKGMTHVRRKRSLELEDDKHKENDQAIFDNTAGSNSLPPFRIKKNVTHKCGKGCLGKHHKRELKQLIKNKNKVENALSVKYLDKSKLVANDLHVSCKNASENAESGTTLNVDEEDITDLGRTEEVDISKLNQENISGDSLKSISIEFDSASNPKYSDSSVKDLESSFRQDFEGTNFAANNLDEDKNPLKLSNINNIDTSTATTGSNLGDRNIQDRLIGDKFENRTNRNVKRISGKRFIGINKILDNLLHCTKCNSSSKQCNHNIGKEFWIAKKSPGANDKDLRTEKPIVSKTEDANVEQNSALLEENNRIEYQSRGLKQYDEGSNEIKIHRRVKRDDDLNLDLNDKDEKDDQSIDAELDSANAKKKRQNLDESEDNAYQYEDSEFNDDNVAYENVRNERINEDEGGNENEPDANENEIAEPDSMENNAYLNGGKSCHCDKNGNNCKCQNSKAQLNNLPNIKQDYQDYGVDPEAGYVKKKSVGGPCNCEKGDKHCKCPQQLLTNPRIKQQYSDYMEDQSEEKLENLNDGESVNEFAFPKLKIPRHAIEARKNVLSPFGRMEYLPKLERSQVSDEAAYENYGDMMKREVKSRRLSVNQNFQNGQYFVDLHPEVYRLSPVDPSREKRENFEDLVAIHGGGPVRSHLVAIKQRSMMPHSRFRRRVLTDDNRLPRQLIDMSDEDLFGALPQSFAGELMRYKRVKRGKTKK